MAGGTPTPTGQEQALSNVLRRTARSLVRGVMQSNKSAVVVSIAVLCILLVTTTHGFASAYNLETLELSIAVAIVVAFGQMAALAIGQFNLALGSIGAASGMLIGWLMQVHHTAVLLAIAAGIVLGALLGLVQGLLIVYTGINAFIISLGIASIYAGILLGLTQSNSYSSLPASFTNLGIEDYLGVSPLVVIALVVALLLALLVARTAFGRELLATGANSRAARLSGIRVQRIVVGAHTLSGLLAGVAGVLLAAQLSSSQPYAGDDWLLPSFAAPVLGGTLLLGGRISVVGAILGACFLEMIDNALILLGVNPYWYQVFLGLIILGALVLERGRVSIVTRRTSS